MINFTEYFFSVPKYTNHGSTEHNTGDFRFRKFEGH
jgi:hypothetical protein